MNLNSQCIPSEKIVAREIEGELIIVPFSSGIGNSDDEIYSLNETGKAIWKRLDEKKNIKTIIDELSREYESPREEIEEDVVGFVSELVTRGILTKL